MIRIFAAAAALVLGLAVLQARAEEFAVIASTVPAVPAGTTLSSGTNLDIPANARIVLVAGSGTVLTLNGPYHGVPKEAQSAAGAPSGDVVTILSALVGSGAQRQVAGVVRATDAEWRQAHTTTPIEALTIDATDGGDVCLFDASHAMLVHNPSRSGKMSIENMSGGAEADIDWPEHTFSLPWPKTLPLADGDNFMFQQTGENAVAVATIHLLPASGTAGDVARAVQMAKAGCRGQARLLVALIAKTAK